MISQKRFLEELDSELKEETGIHACYQKYCGSLRLEDIFTTDSVYMAARRCASGFMDRNDTYAFMQSPWVNASILCRKVLDGTFKPTYYRERKIKERGKERLIKPPTFECKVVQKVLCDMLIRSVFECRMTSTNYASVMGRGTEKLYRDVLIGVNRHVRINPEAVIVMTDFSGHFASISNQKLEEIFLRYIRDSRIVALIRSFAPDQNGLSLGNETSQIPASFFPSSIDHYFKDRLGVREYYRYMDDSLLIAENLEQACHYIFIFKALANELGLYVKDEKVIILPAGVNFVFCKERYIFNKSEGYYYRLMNPAIIRNESRKLKAFDVKLTNGEMELKDVKAQYRGVIGSIKKHPNSKKAICKLEEQFQKIVKKYEL